MFDAATERMSHRDPRRKSSIEHSKAAARKSNYHQSQEVGRHIFVCSCALTMSPERYARTLIGSLCRVAPLGTVIRNA